MSAKGDYYPVGPNMWVANMAYAADVSIEGKLSCLLTPNAPVAASATALLNAYSAASGTKTTLNVMSGQGDTVMGKFGRAVVAVATGTITTPIIVHGYDYLGQGMSESITMASATPVNGKKAFRRVTHVTYQTTAGVTISLGTLNIFGLPYAYLDAGVDFADGAKNGTQGTFVVGVLGAQTATTGDPRGTFAPNASHLPDGLKKYSVMYEPRRNDLYGSKHYFAG